MLYYPEHLQKKLSKKIAQISNENWLHSNTWDKPSGEYEPCNRIVYEPVNIGVVGSGGNDLKIGWIF